MLARGGGHDGEALRIGDDLGRRQCGLQFGDAGLVVAGEVDKAGVESDIAEFVSQGRPAGPQIPGTAAPAQTGPRTVVTRGSDGATTVDTVGGVAAGSAPAAPANDAAAPAAPAATDTSAAPETTQTPGATGGVGSMTIDLLAGREEVSSWVHDGRGLIGLGHVLVI